ncbi:DUF1073 domain-containing protein [Lichenifustis flavocetrariae]|uniref:DUF1073 domain-containing protein n=1 Tax=Lichenifustis flavocetrariae TaxID=2949735 RepID=A0AA41Z0Z9_9HYPH|nr:DUF1073 domain-containing protein [Lichenifustis flavocetrariae]MCW6510976.1 DUF1073 domain-containing protein [Lichenifustis flavocetrariae]
MPHRLSSHAALDSLSNLAASLNAGKDKQAGDAFFIPSLARDQIESLYRGDWLARKIVDIVPYDCVREWRTWAGDRADVSRIESVERSLNLRRAVQRAMVMGRLYGGGALIIGTTETDPAALMTELRPRDVGPNGIAFLHAVSRWQLAVAEIERDPLSPWFGEPKAYEVTAPERGSLTLHPSRVIRFLGNPLADPSLLGADLWSDSVLTALYDAIHAVALTTTGATSLMHEAKVDVVTVPNLSEHLSNAATTAQLSARFSYAATMKSLNNLLLLGDGETWTRQRIDFAGLPEMVRTFLQVAAGAADIPVTRLLGQSPAGLSSTGDHDTRNYYDMIAARQEIELRPQLEHLDRLLLASAGVAPGALSFSFRPLWQMDAATQAAVALSKAQATGIYAGLGLWPTEVMARLVAGQLAEDGIYPDAAAAFEAGAETDSSPQPVRDYSPDQPRDPQGRWTEGGGTATEQSEVSAKTHATAADPHNLTIQPAARVAPMHTGARERAGWSTGSGLLAKLSSGLQFFNPIGSAEAAEIDPEKEIEQATTGNPPPPTEAEPIPKLRPLAGPQLRNSIGSTSPLPGKAGISLLSEPAAEHPVPSSARSTSTSKTTGPVLPSWARQLDLPGIVGPGPYAREAIRVTNSGKISPLIQRQNTETGYRWGCHRCGSKEPGSKSGQFYLDHQVPTALNDAGSEQFIYPHCRTCSDMQGGIISSLKKKGYPR